MYKKKLLLEFLINKWKALVEDLENYIKSFARLVLL